jgi:hypothetical protein
MEDGLKAGMPKNNNIGRRKISKENLILTTAGMISTPKNYKEAFCKHLFSVTYF